MGATAQENRNPLLSSMNTLLSNMRHNPLITKEDHAELIAIIQKGCSTGNNDDATDTLLTLVEHINQLTEKHSKLLLVLNQVLAWSKYLVDPKIQNRVDAKLRNTGFS